MSEKRLRKLVLFCAALLLYGSIAQTSAQTRTRRKAQTPTPATEPAADGETQSASSQVRLKLNNGTRLTVDDAWESEQGFWYRQGGMTYLVTRDRASGIERVTVEPSKAEPQI